MTHATRVSSAQRAAGAQLRRGSLANIGANPPWILRPLSYGVSPEYMRGSAITFSHPRSRASLEGHSSQESGDSEALKASGHWLADAALQLPDQALTVRVRDGKMSATDGPFMETKEVLGGFILIEARDLNEAARLAAGIPLAKLGSIEVRPLVDFSTPRPKL